MTDMTIQKPTYMPGLDGLRALAVFAVIAYHLGLPFAPGGFLGVTLFFVLSGYLITDIMLTEWKKDQTIHMKSFFVRRAKRLLPSVFFLLICLVAFVTVFRPDLFSNFKSEFLPAVFFASNWWYIFNDIPYFTSYATPSLLNHFWSLAVEVQFYLIWPVLLILLQRLIKKNWIKIAITAGIAVLSAVLMAVLFQPGFDPGRIYYGTDTRVFSLLLGACLGFAMPSIKIAETMQKRNIRIISGAVGFVSLLGIILMSCYITLYDDFLYRGGMFLFSVASALLIAAAASHATVIGKIFGFKPLRFIGKISYGVYLWQFPVIVLTNTMVKSTSVNIALSVFQVAATILLATISYYLIEMPIRRGHIFKALKKKASLRDFCAGCLHTRWWEKTAALLVITLVLISGLGFINAEAVPNTTVSDELSALPSQMMINPQNTTEAFTDLPVTSPSPASPAGSPDDSPSNEAPSSQSPEASAPADTTGLPSDSEPAAITPSGLCITVIGDSIAIDIASYLQEYYPNMSMDAEVGRQFYQAKKIIGELIEKNALGSTVVIELGSNGAFSETHMRSLIDLIGSDRKIIFVNTQVPRPWCLTVNSTLSAVSAEYANSTVADWYNVSADKNDYFYNDAFHPNKTGSPVLAKIIAEAIYKLQPYKPYITVQ